MERIICAAIYYNKWEMKHPPKNIETGIVFPGYRHSNCFGLFSCFYAIKDVDHLLMSQWFITSENRYVEREEWLQIALKSWQELNVDKDFLKTQKILFSEDLY